MSEEGREKFCPYCDAPAEVNGVSRTLQAPQDWYRCPECYGSTPLALMPDREKKDEAE